MLLLWYTPPRAGAQRYYANWLMQRLEYNIKDDDEALLLLWWAWSNYEQT